MTCVTQLENTSMAAKLQRSRSILGFSSWFLCPVAVQHLAKVTSALLTSLSRLVIMGHELYGEYFELCGWKALKLMTAVIESQQKGVKKEKHWATEIPSSFFCGIDKWEPMALSDCCDLEQGLQQKTRGSYGTTGEKRLIWPCPAPFSSPGVRKRYSPSGRKCLPLLPVTTVDVLESHINIWSFFIAVRFWAIPVSWSNEFQNVIACCVNKVPFSIDALCEYVEKLVLHLLKLHLPCGQSSSLHGWEREVICEPV